MRQPGQGRPCLHRAFLNEKRSNRSTDLRSIPKGQLRFSAHLDDPSKTIDAPYYTANTVASNLDPTSKALTDRLTADRKPFDEAPHDLVGKPAPSDVLMSSASGLDPDITPANAGLQAARIATARGVNVDEVRALLDRQTKGRQWGLFGDPRVNVLETNLALDRELPRRTPTPAGKVAAAPSAP
jgi:K+-transporting ATPase KdpC subunit